MPNANAKHRAQKTSKDKVFWKQHVTDHANSGLSKMAYCRANQINYACFNYWVKKTEVCAQSAHAMVAVKLTTNEVKLSDNTLLCTLVFKNNHRLQIHDARALSAILDRLS